MKRFCAFVLAVILLAATFPSIALGDESTATVEPSSSVVESTTPPPVPMVPVVSPHDIEEAVETTVPAPAEVVAAETTVSVEPTETPPPSEEPTESVEATETPEPYFADEWADIGAGVDSRDWPGANKNPVWVDWTFEVQGIQNGGGINATWTKAGHLYQDVGSDGTYTFRTLGHDILTEAQVGTLVLSGEDPDEKLSIELVGIAFGPEKPVPVVTKTAEPEPYLPYTELDPEPFLPYTGGNRAIIWLAAICAGMGIALRRYSLL